MIDGMLDEARSRLSRLAQIMSTRLRTLTDDELDLVVDGWSPRQIAFHLEGSAFYADAVGDLTPANRAKQADAPERP